MKKDNPSLIQNQKGVAIEMSILVLLILFTFCVLLTTTSLMVQKKNNLLHRHFVEVHAVEQIAEDFIFEIKKAYADRDDTEVIPDQWSDFADSIEDYEVSISEIGDNYQLEIREKTNTDKEDDAGKLLLFYEVDKTGRILSRSHYENSEIRGN